MLYDTLLPNIFPYKGVLTAEETKKVITFLASNESVAGPRIPAGSSFAVISGITQPDMNLREVWISSTSRSRLAVKFPNSMIRWVETGIDLRGE